MPQPAALADPRELRALAHPLRLQVLADLRVNGPSTATGLASTTGASPALLSYHLRSLAKYGFVHKAPELARDGRERWWRATHPGMTWSQAEFLDTPERAAAAGALMGEIAERYASAARDWLTEVPNWPGEWIAVADMSDWPIVMSVERAERLREELHDVLERYAASDEDAEGELVRIILHLLPQRRERRPP